MEMYRRAREMDAAAVKQEDYIMYGVRE
jgi:hypothetical protein